MDHRNAIKNLLLTILIIVTPHISAQSTFQNILTNSNYDHNHYNIENGSNFHLIGGTMFEAGSLDNNLFHFAEINSNNIVWGSAFELNGATGRCLDIELGPNNSFYATGYIEHNTVKYAFVMHLDATGQLLAFEKLSLIIEDGTLLETIGLKLHYSLNENTLYIAGYASEDIASVTSSKSAFVSALHPTNFSAYWSKEITSYDEDHTYNLINHIIEVVGEGLVLTGSSTFDDGASKQGVLCLLIDFNGSLKWDLSHQSLESGTVVQNHSGVKSIYDPIKDQLYVLSNNSSWHTFQITEISEVSSSATITNRFSNTIYTTNTSNAIGVDMVWSNSAPNDLIVAGYLETDNPGQSNHNSPFFLAQINRNDGSTIWGKKWFSENNSYINHDYDFLQLFFNQQPFGYTPEIIDKTASGYNILTYNTSLNNLNPVLAQTDNIGNIEGNCHESWGFCGNNSGSKPSLTLLENQYIPQQLQLNQLLIQSTPIEHSIINSTCTD